MNDQVDTVAAIICMALALAVAALAGHMRFWKLSARYNQTLPSTTLYHYVRNHHIIEQDNNGVIIRPRYRVDAKGRQAAWGTMMGKKK